jgi:uncharacterized membrane protein YfcA
VLAGIGLVSGFFAALFGVGGGIVIVPLLILSAGFASKPATGTSLAAIGLTALFGSIAYGALGDVEWLHGVQVGLPAALGTLAGASLQQRLSSRTLTLLFSGFLVAVAILLLLK